MSWYLVPWFLFPTLRQTTLSCTRMLLAVFSSEELHGNLEGPYKLSNLLSKTWQSNQRGCGENMASGPEAGLMLS